jgi:hypothetical protein
MHGGVYLKQLAEFTYELDAQQHELSALPAASSETGTAP